MTKVLIAGPIFNTKDGPSGEGGKLYTKLAQEKYEVYRCSHFRNKFLRNLHIMSFILFRQNKYEVLIVQAFSYKAFLMVDLATLFARMLNKRIIITIHGGAMVEFYQKYSKWFNKVLKRADCLNTPSFYLQQFFQSIGYKVKLVPNFIETNNFRYNRNQVKPHTILWVRAFNDIYNPELAIKILSIVKKTCPDIKLTMVGPDKGTLLKCLDLIEKLSLNKNVEITGSVPNKELFNYYQTHEIYLNTTSFESFGVALVEAACCGIPIVSTKGGEIPYLWQNNHDMILVDSFYAEDFAEQVLDLLNNNEKEKFLSGNAREKAENYTWEKVKDLWDDVIKE